MTITTHRCQCHEIEHGLCYPCEASLADELHALEDETHERNRSEFEQLNPPSGSEVWPR